MKLCAKKTIFEISPYVPGKPIDEVKRELGLKDVIKLASNENPYGPSPKVLQAISQASKEINRYPDSGCFYLRKELAKKLKISPNQLIFGNGSDELIVLAVRGLVNEGDEVIIAKPSFLIYAIASKLEGANIKEVPLDRFRYDLTGMNAAITDRTKIIFIGNPDNPAGSIITQEGLSKFLPAIRRDILVFVDEAYYEYVEAKDYADTLSLLKTYENLFIIRTFSKMYGLAGLRIGYGIGHEEFVGWLNRIREPFNVNSLAQVAALACLKDQPYYRAIAKKIRQERRFLYKSFKQLQLNFIESWTNFILVKVSNAKEVSLQLMKKGVIVRDMSFWGLPYYIRVTIGNSAENKRFIKVLEEIV